MGLHVLWGITYLTLSDSFSSEMEQASPTEPQLQALMLIVQG